MSEKYKTKDCSITGHCLLLDIETDGKKFSMQLPIERAKEICLAVNNHDMLVEALSNARDTLYNLRSWFNIEMSERPQPDRPSIPAMFKCADNRIKEIESCLAMLNNSEIEKESK